MSKRVPCPKCGTRLIDSRAAQCVLCRNGATAAPVLPVDAQVTADRERHQQSRQSQDLSSRYKEALRVIDEQQQAISALTTIGDGAIGGLSIEPKFSSSTSEAAVVTPASDWHIEELVGAEVNGLNTFNLAIAERRVKEFFQHSLRLVRLLEQDVKIPTWVLPLLGDYITGNIHGEENAEKNELMPIEAILVAQQWISSGIDFILNNSTQHLVIPCHSGNHARTTKTTRFSAENGHSLEYFMFVNLAKQYANQSRVKFVVPEGIHSYIDVYGQTLRFHHGHAVKYGGGVGGLYIPVNKAIAQWNKAKRADLDVFGHFHQMRDGGNFICNGSLIGYNSFALSIKADYEPPAQQLILMNRKRGRTCVWPVFVS